MQLDQRDFQRLFLNGTPLLDLRAPVEFARGAFPQAHNLPLMTDSERAEVGTCYTREGQAAAIALGQRLVSGSVRTQRIEAWLAFTRAHPQGFLYCFRGGLRSQIVQQWLREAGVDYPRISGGYKALRQYLLEVLESAASSQPCILIAGRTGAGKTRLLNHMPRAVDLEGLAQHRGSAFGALLQAQPTQIDFENALAIALLRLRAHPGPVFLEDESRLIGRLALPLSLYTSMQKAPWVELELPLAERIQVVLEDYILDLGQRYAQAYGNAGPTQHRDRLQGDLDRIRNRLGGERHQRVSSLLQQGFAAPAEEAAMSAHRAWIRLLLEDYYDPMYDHHMQRRQGPCLLRAAPAEVLAWAQSAGPA